VVALIATKFPVERFVVVALVAVALVAIKPVVVTSVAVSEEKKAEVARRTEAKNEVEVASVAESFVVVAEPMTRRFWAVSEVEESNHESDEDDAQRDWVVSQ
jgi:hypothetical protein